MLPSQQKHNKICTSLPASIFHEGSQATEGGQTLSVPFCMGHFLLHGTAKGETVREGVKQSKMEAKANSLGLIFHADCTVVIIYHSSADLIYWELTLKNWMEAFFQRVWPTKGTNKEWILNSPASSAEKWVLCPAGSNDLRDSLFSSILGSLLGDTVSEATKAFSPNVQKICSGLKLEMDLRLLLHCGNVSPTVKTSMISVERFTHGKCRTCTWFGTKAWVPRLSWPLVCTSVPSCSANINSFTPEQNGSKVRENQNPDLYWWCILCEQL